MPSFKNAVLKYLEESEISNTIKSSTSTTEKSSSGKIVESFLSSLKKNVNEENEVTSESFMTSLQKNAYKDKEEEENEVTSESFMASLQKNAYKDKEEEEEVTSTFNPFVEEEKEDLMTDSISTFESSLETIKTSLYVLIILISVFLFFFITFRIICYFLKKHRSRNSEENTEMKSKTFVQKLY